MTETYVRDEELGRALRELETPEHAPVFDADLAGLLAQDQLRRRSRRRRLLLLLAAVAVVVVAGLSVGITRLGGPGVATAADVQARLRSTLASLTNVQGRLVETAPDPISHEPVTRRWSFTLTDRGDFRLDEVNGPGRLAYDAATGVERQLNTSASTGTGLFASERSGLAPGPPDAGPTTSILDRDLGSVVRALLAAREADVRGVRYEDRKAWQVELAVPPNAIYADADRFRVTVDEATGLPLRVVDTLRGKETRELRVEGLQVDAPVPAGTFTLSLPTGLEVSRTAYGFARVGLGAVPETVGYEPLVPRWIPSGYALAEVAVARRAQPTGVEGADPASVDVVSLAYRRGFDELLVTTRRAGSGSWSDPLATGEGFVDHPAPVRVASGALARAEAHVLVAPRVVPHLWTLTNGLVVTVSGDLERAELLRVTSSLARAAR